MNSLTCFPAAARRRRHRAMLVLGALLAAIGLPAQPPAVSSVPTVQPVPAMKTFVILFRQGSQPLTDADKQRRAEETGPWARRQNAAGHKLDPRILAPESARRGPEGASVAAEAQPLIALLFLEARDLAEAVSVAESHPAVRYGSTVEVRPWAPPAPALSAQKPR